MTRFRTFMYLIFLSEILEGETEVYNTDLNSTLIYRYTRVIHSWQEI